MVNQSSSIVAALFARAKSLDARLSELGNVIIDTDPADKSFTRRRFEVLARQRNDAFDAYWTATRRTGYRIDFLVYDDMQVLDYLLVRLA